MAFLNQFCLLGRWSPLLSPACYWFALNPFSERVVRFRVSASLLSSFVYISIPTFSSLLPIALHCLRSSRPLLLCSVFPCMLLIIFNICRSLDVSGFVSAAYVIILSLLFVLIYLFRHTVFCDSRGLQRLFSDFRFSWLLISALRYLKRYICSIIFWSTSSLRLIHSLDVIIAVWLTEWKRLSSLSSESAINTLPHFLCVLLSFAYYYIRSTMVTNLVYLLW